MTKIVRLIIAMIMLMIMVSSCASKRVEDPIDEEEIPSVEEDKSQVEVNNEVIDKDSETETGDEDDVDSNEAIEENQSNETNNEVISDNTVKDEEEILEEEIDYALHQVNELGHIMVVMYHGIKDQPPYHRTKDNFIKDLTFMYDHGYELTTMRDYLDGTINVALGKTPIVFTFDDGLSTTFSLVEVDGELVVNPDSAIGIIEDFAKEHPDFGKTASLYIHDTRSNFRGDGDDVQRLTWLLENGYEIGNHSATHANFKSLSAEALQKEIGQVDEYIAEVLPEYRLFALTYPYGAKPESSLIPLLSEGSYKSFDLNYEVAFREGPSAKFYPPLHRRFTPLTTPRVRGSEGEIQDLWWFLEYYEEHKDLKYISDGNPETLVIPSDMEEFLGDNEDKLSKLELIIYDKEVVDLN